MERKEDSTFSCFPESRAAFDPWLNSSVLEPAGEGCFCWAAVVMETSRDKRGKRLPEMTSELKTGYSCSSCSQIPVLARFFSSWVVGVVALMEGEEAALYLSQRMVIFTPFTTQQNKCSGFFFFFFVSHLVQKNKKRKIKEKNKNNEKTM